MIKPQENNMNLCDYPYNKPINDQTCDYCNNPEWLVDYDSGEGKYELSETTKQGLLNWYKPNSNCIVFNYLLL